MNPQQPWAEALAIRGEKIVAVEAARRTIATRRGPSTHVIDAQGRLVVPGFTRLPHPLSRRVAEFAAGHMEKARTVGEIQRKVKEYADAHPGLAWILGRGWKLWRV